MTLYRFNGVRRALAIAALTALAGGVTAQEFPSKPIRIIDAFTPGGTTDILARMLVPHISPRLGQTVLVESKSGANGLIGSEYVARSAPDGYTLFVGSTSTLAVNQLLYKMSFDPLKAFAPVSLLAAQPLILVVHPSVPAKSVTELISFAKSNPEAVNYATPGIGNPLHLATELFKKMSGAPMTHVPYNRGSAAAYPDLIAGQVQVMFAPMAVLPMVNDKRLRALAVTGSKRLKLLPDVPTVDESGVKGFEVTIWNALAVPAGTPKDIVAKLNGEVVRALKLPEVQEQMMKRGLEPIPSTPEEQERFTLAEAERWGTLIKEIGIRIE